MTENLTSITACVDRIQSKKLIPHSLIVEYSVVFDFSGVGQIIQRGVQKRLDAFVLQRCAHQHRSEESLNRGPADRSLENKNVVKSHTCIHICSIFSSNRAENVDEKTQIREKDGARRGVRDDSVQLMRQIF